MDVVFRTLSKCFISSLPPNTYRMLCIFIQTKGRCKEPTVTRLVMSLISEMTPELLQIYETFMYFVYCISNLAINNLVSVGF